MLEQLLKAYHTIYKLATEVPNDVNAREELGEFLGHTFRVNTVRGEYASWISIERSDGETRWTVRKDRESLSSWVLRGQECFKYFALDIEPANVVEQTKQTLKKEDGVEWLC